MSGTWTCRKMARGEMNADPVQEEFFTPREDRVDGLVRETDQNTLDAGLPGKPVRVRYTVSDKSLPSRVARRYLTGLEPHLTACLPELPLDTPGFGRSVNSWCAQRFLLLLAQRRPIEEGRY